MPLRYFISDVQIIFLFLGNKHSDKTPPPLGDTKIGMLTIHYQHQQLTDGSCLEPVYPLYVRVDSLHHPYQTETIV